MDSLGKWVALLIALLVLCCGRNVAQDLASAKAYARGTMEQQYMDTLCTTYDRTPEMAKEVAQEYLLKARKYSFLYLECEANNALGRAYRRLGAYDSSLAYHYAATRIAVAMNDPLSIGNSEIGAGLAFKMQGEYNLAIKYMNLALESYRAAYDKNREARALNNLGNLYRVSGNYKQAIRFHNEALDIRKELALENDIAVSYNNLGVIFFEQENLNKAVTYQEMAIDIRRKNGKRDLLSSSFLNLSEALSSLEAHKRAIFFADSALWLARQSGEMYETAVARMNLGKVLFRAGFREQGLHQLDSASMEFPDFEMNENVIENKLLLGESYFELGNADLGLKLTRQTQQMADISGTFRLEARALEALVNHYKKTGVDDSVFFYKSSLEEVNRKMNDYAINLYRTELDIQQQLTEDRDGSDAEIFHLAREEARQDLRVKYGSIYGILVTILVLTVGGALWILWYRYQEQRRLIQILHEQKHEIERQNQALARSNLELAQFTHVVSHDLKQPLRTIGSFSSLIERRYYDKLDASGRDYLSFIRKGVGHMHQLLSDLLMYAQIGQSRMEKQELDLNEVLDHVLWNLQREITESNGQVQVETLPQVFANRISLIQLFQNLIGNALKFRADRPPLIRVSCKDKTNLWLIEVSDNGIGISADDKQKVFELFQRSHHIEEYSGTGIGLSICQKVVQQHGGRIWVESEEGIGSTFYLSLSKNRSESLPALERSPVPQTTTF